MNYAYISQLRKDDFLFLFPHRTSIVFPKRLNITHNSTSSANFSSLSNESWRSPVLITRQRAGTFIIVNSIIVRLTRVSANRRYMRIYKRINTGGSGLVRANEIRGILSTAKRDYIRAIQAVICSNDSRFLDIDYELALFNSVLPLSREFRYFTVGAVMIVPEGYTFRCNRCLEGSSNEQGRAFEGWLWTRCYGAPAEIPNTVEFYAD